MLSFGRVCRAISRMRKVSRSRFQRPLPTCRASARREKPRLPNTFGERQNSLTHPLGVPSKRSRGSCRQGVNWLCLPKPNRKCNKMCSLVCLAGHDQDPLECARMSSRSVRLGISEQWFRRRYLKEYREKAAQAAAEIARIRPDAGRFIANRRRERT